MARLCEEVLLLDYGIGVCQCPFGVEHSHDDRDVQNRPLREEQMETILSIRPYSDKVKPDRYEVFVEGFEVQTTEQVIRLYIDMDGQCCERAGYSLTEDNPDEYVGAQLFDVRLTDTALNEAKMAENEVGGKYFWGGSCSLTSSLTVASSSSSPTTNRTATTDTSQRSNRGN